MISAQEHYSTAIEDMRERQALELQEMQSKLSQSYDDHVAAIAELSIARTTLESFREESAFAQRQHAEIVDSLRTQLEEALSDVEAASAFRFRVRDDANEEIKAAHRYSVLGFRFGVLGFRFKVLGLGYWVVSVVLFFLTIFNTCMQGALCYGASAVAAAE